MAKAKRKRTYTPPTVVRITLRFPEDIHTGLSALAEKDGVSFHTKVMDICRAALAARATLPHRHSAWPPSP